MDENEEQMLPVTTGISAADVETVVSDIMRGRHDMNLELITRAIRRRNQQMAEARAMSLKVGDRVVIHGVGMGAKYLNGMTGTVTGFATKNIYVRIDPEYDTRRFSHNMRLSPTIIRRIELA